MDTKIYAAYGSNIDLKQMAFRCPGAMVIGTGFAEGYRLTFRSGGFANIEKSAGDKVPVLIWKITGSDERNLDRYEGFPHFYEKIDVPITSGDRKITAMVYVIQEKARGGCHVPSEFYYSGIERGYIANGMPVNYLEKALDECMEAQHNGR